MKRILVTGGTGMLGTAFAGAARRAGHRVRIMSRREPAEASPEHDEWARADLISGEGLDAAVQGVDVILHSATARAVGDYRKVDLEGTRRLLDTVRSSGVAHLVYPSIVGVDEIPLGYYEVKHRAEEAILEAGTPATVVRATPFHAFVDEFLGMLARLPIMPVPAGFRVQSVSGPEFADELLRLVDGAASGRAPDFAGPQVLKMPQMARDWTRARGKRRLVAPLPLPGKAAGAFRAGAATNPDRAAGRQRWGEWLGEKFSGEHL